MGSRSHERREREALDSMRVMLTTLIARTDDVASPLGDVLHALLSAALRAIEVAP